MLKEYQRFEIMEHEPELVTVLHQLACGEIEPDRWIDWWNEKSDWVATLLNRGQFLRLKPTQLGESGSASRCAVVSQAGACKLLDTWGIEYEFSDRYQRQWESDFEEFCAREESQRKYREERFGAVLKSLETSFPRFARFLHQNLDTIGLLEAGASDEEITACESSLKVTLPEAYKRFLKCCKAIELGDTIKMGLPHTFVQSSVESTPLTGDMLCFGECWLEADGDEVFFSEFGPDPAIVLYAHEVPELRDIGANFNEWVEGIPKWDSWE